MKHRTLFLLCTGLLVSGLIFAGCGKKEKKAKPEPTTQPAVNAAVEKAVTDASKAVAAAKTAGATAADASKTADAAKAASDAAAAAGTAKVADVAKATNAEPAKAAAAATDKQKTPWADAKVGDMAKYKGMAGMTMTFEVTAVDDNNATVKITTAMEGAPPNATDMPMPRFAAAGTAAKPADANVKDLGTEDLTIAGQKLTCKVTETTSKMGDKTITTKSWMCDKVPGGGVKTMSDAMGSMQVMQELVEFKKQ